MQIPFTQYLMPDGRRDQVFVERDGHVATKAQEILNFGLRFECEVLSNGVCSFTIFDNEIEEDVAHKLSKNGPEVLKAVDSMIEEFSFEEWRAYRAQIIPQDEQSPTPISVPPVAGRNVEQSL